MAELVIRNVNKSYPGQKTKASDDVSLTIDHGEFMVLLGPSGCGKTTLLRAIAGLDLPDDGQIVIGGRDVTFLPPRQRNLSMVFQSYAVFPHRKVRYNIGFGLAMHRKDKKHVAEKVEWAAGLLQLEPYLDRYPAQLSGGQRQRVAVARAIVMDPDVLLMDEPLSNLDALLRLNFRADLKKLVSDLGTTCVYVTHDQVEALSLGDRVAVMDKGRIVQCAPPLEVYDHPASDFVGGFIGNPPMNFVPGQVGGQGNDVTVRMGEQTIAAPAALASYSGRPIRVGFRAETLAVADGDARDAARTRVDVVEPLGSATLLTVELAGEKVKVQVPSDMKVAAGDDLWLQMKPERLRFYDPETHLLLDTRR